MTTIIFACMHSAGRSQMAAALFNALADAGQVRAIAAGTRPAKRVHPEVAAVMREAGIDIENAIPRLLTEELARQAQMLVTMGCGEQCPLIPGLPREDWELPDPAGRSIEYVRAIRETVRERVRILVETRGWQRR